MVTKKTKNSKIRNTVFRFFNVVIYPEEHQKEKNYIIALDKIFKRGTSVYTYQDKITKMYSLNRLSDESLIYGTIINYTKLKGEERCYNEETGMIEEKEMDPNLNPNCKEWEFYFMPSKHRMAIPKNGRVSYSQIVKFFEVELKEVADSIGCDRIEFNPVATKNAIKDIFELDTIERLEVTVSYTNNDMNEGYDQLISDELSAQGVDNLKTIATGGKGAPFTLKKRSYLGGIVTLAQEYGKAMAKGVKDNIRKTINTIHYPLEKKWKISEENLYSDIKDIIERRNEDE